MSKYDPSKLKVRIEAPSLKFQQRDLAPAGEIGEELPAAVIVFHGIGEEVKFGTLSSAVSLLLTEADERGADIGEVVIHSVARDNPPTDLVVRAELKWTEKDGTKRQVHVYEVYWAPLTLGKVTYWETIGFLLSAGWNGLLGTILSGRLRKFPRWLFGGFRDVPIKAGTVRLLIPLIFTVLFIFAAIAMAVTAAAGVARGLSGQGSTTENARQALSFLYNQVALPWNWIAEHMHLPHWLLFDPGPLRNHKCEVAFVLLLWAAGVGLAYWLRNILTVYVGSLVAYLSPYKDSKWEELRGAIQQRGLDIAKAVYNGHTLPLGSIPNYKDILILGHSLGSVIAYDTLNAMINIASASLPDGTANPVVQRTRSLITFGSPLDKTAFLFRMQLHGLRKRQDTAFLRETMVSAVQPLITNYDQYRYHPGPPRQRPRWINIWSKRDIVSGSLAYYDDPELEETDPRRVQNIIDPQSQIPLYAHLQYWSKKLLRKTAYDELFGVDPTTPSPAASPD